MSGTTPLQGILRQFSVVIFLHLFRLFLDASQNYLIASADVQIASSEGKTVHKETNCACERSERRTGQTALPARRLSFAPHAI